MKNEIFSAIAMVVFIACNSNSEKGIEGTPKDTILINTTTKKENMNPVREQLYTCSMHPEVTGKKDEKCSKCGMDLTVPVKNRETPENNKQ